MVLRRALRELDDEGIKLSYFSLVYSMMQSEMRSQVAELTRIKATCAIIPAERVPVSELKPLRRSAGKAVRR
jgi:hypothetical protein